MRLEGHKKADKNKKIVYIKFISLKFKQALSIFEI